MDTTTKPWALVTGASSGIGREIAREFAERGYDLIINAEDDGIKAVAEHLRTLGAQVDAIQADLRKPHEVEHLFTEARRGRQVAAAALNAGVGRGGAFVGTDLAHDMEIIDLNVRSTVHLAKLLLRDMVARDEGRLLITSSIASTMPGTYQATYNASKSFLQSFAQALAQELADTSVTVTSLMPGPTETNFFHRADMDDTPVGRASKDDPAQVARQGVDALLADKRRVVGGSLKTKVQEAAAKVMPDQVKAVVHGVMAKPKS